MMFTLRGHGVWHCQKSSGVYRRDEYAWSGNHHAGVPGIAYSDGDEIEGRLKNIIEGASDVSVMSIELAGRCAFLKGGLSTF